MTKTKQQVTCSEDAVAAIRPAFPRRVFRKQEGFAVLLLDAKHRPLRSPIRVALGTLQEVAVHPRDVFRDAVQRNAYTIIIAHNHPSGDPEPSPGDIKLTDRLVEAGKLLAIPVLDHLIISAERFVSLAERGYLDTTTERTDR